MGSDFLFTTPGFPTGVSRLLDLFNVVDDYNFAPTPQLADAIATRADWKAVGGDLAAATACWRLGASPEQLELFDEDAIHAVR